MVGRVEVVGVGNGGEYIRVLRAIGDVMLLLLFFEKV